MAFFCKRRAAAAAGCAPSRVFLGGGGRVRERGGDETPDDLSQTNLALSLRAPYCVLVVVPLTFPYGCWLPAADPKSSVHLAPGWGDRPQPAGQGAAVTASTQLGQWRKAAGAWCGPCPLMVFIA